MVVTVVNGSLLRGDLTQVMCTSMLSSCIVLMLHANTVNLLFASLVKVVGL